MMFKYLLMKNKGEHRETTAEEVAELLKMQAL